MPYLLGWLAATLGARLAFFPAGRPRCSTQKKREHQLEDLLMITIE